MSGWPVTENLTDHRRWCPAEAQLKGSAGFFPCARIADEMHRQLRLDEAVMSAISRRARPWRSRLNVGTFPSPFVPKEPQNGPGDPHASWPLQACAGVARWKEKTNETCRIKIPAT